MDINQFRDRLASTKVKCELCAYLGHSVIAHLQATHGLSANQYREQFPSARLVSHVVSELMRRLGRDSLSTDDLGELIEAFDFDNSNVYAELEKIGARFATTVEQTAFIGEVDSYFVFDEQVKLIAYGMRHCKNIFNEGPTGCGKTESFIQAHARAKRPFKQVNMHGDVTAANFIGQLKANPQKGTYYEYGDLPAAMGYPLGLNGPVQPGYTLIIDELDYTPPQIASVLNPVLSRQRQLHLMDTGETIVAREGFNIMATANTGGKGDLQGNYTGTEVLNTAFLDRFPIKLKADYLGWVDGLPAHPEVEVGMLKQRFAKVPEADLKAMVKAANEIRVAFKAGNLAVTMSSRKLVDYFRMSIELNDWPLARRATLINWLTDDDRALVDQMLTRCGVQ